MSDRYPDSEIPGTNVAGFYPAEDDGYTEVVAAYFASHGEVISIDSPVARRLYEAQGRAEAVEASEKAHALQVDAAFRVLGRLAALKQLGLLPEAYPGYFYPKDEQTDQG